MSDKVYEFNSSNQVGKVGEEFVLSQLKTLPQVSEIIDVSDNRHYQIEDVDFFVRFVNGQEYKVEIKTDTYKSGNLFFEIYSNVETRTQGCLMKTKADYLFYYFVNLKSLYVFHMEDFKKFVLDNLNSFKQRTVKNLTFNSMGYLVPLKFIEENFKNMKKYRVDT